MKPEPSERGLVLARRAAGRSVGRSRRTDPPRNPAADRLLAAHGRGRADVDHRRSLLLGQIGEIGQARAPAPHTDSGAASSSARTRASRASTVPCEVAEDYARAARRSLASVARLGRAAHCPLKATELAICMTVTAGVFAQHRDQLIGKGPSVDVDRALVGHAIRRSLRLVGSGSMNTDTAARPSE